VNYFVWTIGCQMNVADSRRLSSALEIAGCSPASTVEQADVIVLNTCVVRQSAEDRVYGRLGSLRPIKRARPDVVIALMGCLVGLGESAPLRKRFPWVDVFLPPSEIGPLLDLLSERGLADEARTMAAVAATHRSAVDEGEWLLPADDRGRLVSAYVPVVLGCSHACTYCVIPYRRGRERSRPPSEIVAEARALAAQGVREVTLLGQIVDRYGYDLRPRAQSEAGASSGSPLVAVLEAVHEVERLQRIRFLTSHPNWLADDLLVVVAGLRKVCEHIEVPIQSGDNEVLSRMRRGYSVDDYRALVGRIRAAIPGVSIATDIIVGFPGETEAQFENTYDLLAELRLDKAHIARYSPRPQTLAARRYADDVPRAEKERRRKRLDDLQARIVAEINGRLGGTVVQVLVEGQKKGRWWGRTRTDRLVFFDSEDEWLGRVAPILITWTGPWSLIGEPQARAQAPRPGV
jgi:tRNA-2-methylthio-N6-dimethylallyladenosine synthase